MLKIASSTQEEVASAQFLMQHEFYKQGLKGKGSEASSSPQTSLSSVRENLVLKHQRTLSPKMVEF